MADGHTVRIRTTRFGMQDEVEVGGVRIEKGLRSYELQASVNEMPRLVIDFAVLDVAEVSAEGVQLYIPPATVEALVALGWTPPGDDRP